jgi:phage regulator Rha-like protein
MFHFGTSRKGRGGTRKLPQVFTEQGVAMLSSVLNSKRAIQVSIQIIRTFTKMREMLATHKDLRDKIEKMERENKENFKIIFKVITKLIKSNPENEKKEKIGFKER